MGSKKKLWIAGITLAICGVVFVRVISQTTNHSSAQVILYFVGITLAFAGLAVIMFAISRH
jgi:drug/metabolite transporter (DMT)-like permease